MLRVRSSCEHAWLAGANIAWVFFTFICKPRSSSQLYTLVAAWFSSCEEVHLYVDPDPLSRKGEEGHLQTWGMACVRFQEELWCTVWTEEGPGHFPSGTPQLHVVSSLRDLARSPDLLRTLTKTADEPLKSFALRGRPKICLAQAVDRCAHAQPHACSNGWLSWEIQCGGTSLILSSVSFFLVGFGRLWAIFSVVVGVIFLAIDGCWLTLWWRQSSVGQGALMARTWSHLRSSAKWKNWIEELEDTWRGQNSHLRNDVMWHTTTPFPTIPGSNSWSMWKNRWICPEGRKKNRDWGTGLLGRFWGTQGLCFQFLFERLDVCVEYAGVRACVHGYWWCWCWCDARLFCVRVHACLCTRDRE